MNKKYIIPIIVVVALVLAVVYFFFGGRDLLSPQDENTYQAVFLSNGQVYFGKLSLGGSWLTLSDVYYLQATSALQSGETSSNAQQKIGLVKLGSELHGPNDKMLINKEQVLFWENMKADSKVLGAIKQYQSGAN